MTLYEALLLVKPALGSLAGPYSSPVGHFTCTLVCREADEAERFSIPGAIHTASKGLLNSHPCSTFCSYSCCCRKSFESIQRHDAEIENEDNSKITDSSIDIGAAMGRVGILITKRWSDFFRASKDSKGECREKILRKPAQEQDYRTDIMISIFAIINRRDLNGRIVHIHTSLARRLRQERRPAARPPSAQRPQNLPPTALPSLFLLFLTAKTTTNSNRRPPFSLAQLPTA